MKKPKETKPCKDCGACPTCGRSAAPTPMPPTIIIVQPAAPAIAPLPFHPGGPIWIAPYQPTFGDPFAPFGGMTTCASGLGASVC